jgi:hypothetical protein
MLRNTFEAWVEISLPDHAIGHKNENTRTKTDPKSNRLKYSPNDITKYRFWRLADWPALKRGEKIDARIGNLLKERLIIVTYNWCMRINDRNLDGKRRRSCGTNKKPNPTNLRSSGCVPEKSHSTKS